MYLAPDQSHHLVINYYLTAAQQPRAGCWARQLVLEESEAGTQRW